MSAESVSKEEEEFLEILTKVKEEDRLTWDAFGGEDWSNLEVICRDNWKLQQLQITKIKAIWKKHPANQKAPQPQGE